MTRHLSALVAAAAFAAATSPALGQSAPPTVVIEPAPAGAPFIAQGGQGAYQVAPSAQGGWVWHGEGSAAAGMPYSHGPYAQGSWVWNGEGAPAAGYGYASGGASSCGCPGSVAWVRVPVESRYSYSPAIRHDKQVVEQHTVNDIVVDRGTAPVPQPTKYVKARAAKVTKVTKVRATK
jgi:hypothetical protein